MSTINLTISDDIEANRVLDSLASQCGHMTPTDRDQIISQISTIIYDLEQRGKDLASLGSQFRTVKTLQLLGCKIQISATYGNPKYRSLFSWLRSFLP